MHYFGIEDHICNSNSLVSASLAEGSKHSLYLPVPKKCCRDMTLASTKRTKSQKIIKFNTKYIYFICSKNSIAMAHVHLSQAINCFIFPKPPKPLTAPVRKVRPTCLPAQASACPLGLHQSFLPGTTRPVVGGALRSFFAHGMYIQAPKMRMRTY